MPLYELNHMHSHRHPFVGGEDDYEELIGDADLDDLEEASDYIYLDGDVDGYFFGEEATPKGSDKKAADAKLKAFEKSIQQPKKPTVPSPDTGAGILKKDSDFDIMTMISPVIAALSTTAITYGIARAVNVDKKKAFKVSAIMGGFAGISQIFGNWMKDKIEDLRKLQEEEQRLLAQKKVAPRGLLHHSPTKGA